MASFTDSSVLDKLTSFNPYVQQLPVEAMVKVGMAKQEQYNQGIQKIQTAIDNIAGLDIAKDADKAYLQSKLNELGNNLKFVAAGDFSDFQLVNSVNGMTNQLVKDSNVQNAVAATAKLRKELAFMEEERKAGKLHRNNEIYFNDGYEKYMSSDKIGESFNVKYQPYTDYQKKWREIKKDLDIKEDTTDLPFLMDKAGNYIDAKGNILPPGSKPVPNDYMIKETFKGIDPARLKQAIMSAMDDNDYRQMQIDGYVQYKGYTPEMLADVAQKRFDETQKPLLTTIEKLKILKDQNLGNQKAIDIIDKQLNSNYTVLENNKKDFEESLSDIYNNPEGFKTKLFTMDSINQFSNSFSNISHIQQVVDSPIKKQMNEDRNYNFSVIKFQTENAQWEKTHNLAVRKQLADEQDADFKNKLELYKLGLGPNPLGPSSKYKGAPSTDKEVLDGVIESFQQEASINQLKEDRNALKGQWAKNQLTKNAYANSIGKDPSKVTDKEYKDFLDDKFVSDLQSYRNNPNKKLNPGIKQIFDQYNANDKLYKLKVNTINDVREQVDNRFKGVESAVTSSLEKEKGLSMSINGKPTSNFYSAKDIYNIDHNVSKYIKYKQEKSSNLAMVGGLGPGRVNTQLTFDDEGAKRNLNEKEYKIYLGYKAKYYGKPNNFISEFQRKAVDLKGRYGKLYDKILKDKDNAFLVELGNRINSIVPVTQSLPAGFANKMSPLIEDKFAREQKGQTEEAAGFVVGKDFNIDTTRALALDKETLTNYTTYGDDVYVTLTGKIGKDTQVQKFKVSKSEFNDLFPNVLEDDVNLDFLKSSAANGSTNYKYHSSISAENNPKDAFTTANYSNTNTKKYVVKGDVFFDPNDKNQTIGGIYVMNPKTGNVISIFSDTFNSFKGSVSAIGQINDAVIDNYLKNNNINANF